MRQKEDHPGSPTCSSSPPGVATAVIKSASHASEPHDTGPALPTDAGDMRRHPAGLLWRHPAPVATLSNLRRGRRRRAAGPAFTTTPPSVPCRADTRHAWDRVSTGGQIRHRPAGEPAPAARSRYGHGVWLRRRSGLYQLPPESHRADRSVLRQLPPSEGFAPASWSRQSPTRRMPMQITA